MKIKSIYTLFLGCLAVSHVFAGTTSEAWDLIHTNKVQKGVKAFEEIIDDDDVDNEVVESHIALSLIKKEQGLYKQSLKHILKSFEVSKDTLQFVSSISLLHSVVAAADDDDMDDLMGWAKSEGYWQGKIFDALLRNLLKEGEVKKVQRANKGLGVISDWKWIGPFDNTSGLGFNKVYVPETQIDFSKIYKGKNDNLVKWNSIDEPTSKGWIFLSHHTSESDGVFYFWSNIEAEKDKEVILGFGHSGTFKVFVNDELVLADSVFKNTGTDAYSSKIKLKKGSNPVLLKIGHEGSDDRSQNTHFSNFYMRIAESDFTEIEDVKLSNELKTAYDWKLKSTRKNLKSSIVKSKVDQWYKAVKSPTWGQRILYTHFLIGLEYRELGQSNFEKMLSEAPTSELIQINLANIYSRTGKNVEAEKLIEKISRMDSEYKGPWYVKMYKEYKKGESSKFINFLGDSNKRFSEDLEIKFLLFELYASEERTSELLELLTEFEDHKEKPGVAIMLSNIAKARGQSKSALKLLKNSLEENQNNVTLYNMLYKHYLSIGDFEGAVEVLEELKMQTPEDPDPSFMLANVFLMRKDYDRALKEAKETLKKVPQGEATLNLVANIYLAMGNKEAGLKHLQEIVDYTSADYDAFDQIREASGLAPLDDLVEAINVDSIVKSVESWSKKDYETGSIPLNVKDVYRYPSGGIKTRQSVLAYLPTQEAINEWKEQSLSFNSAFQGLKIEKAISIHQDGSEVEADKNYNRMVFKSLSPGDFVYFQWVTYDYYNGDMASKVWGNMEFTNHSPRKLQQLRLISPKADSIPYNVYGNDIKVSKSTSGDYEITELKREDYKDKLPNRFLPESWKGLQEVTYSSFKSWQDISTWYEGMSSNKAEVTSELKAIADSLTKNLKNDIEKVEAIHKWLVSTIRYSYQSFRQSGWVPQTSTLTLSSKVGDCKDMSVIGKTLFELAGIEADLVLVNTERKRNLDQIARSPNFNHAILSYVIDGKRSFVDFTVENMRFDGLPGSDQGAMALVVTKEGKNELIALPIKNASPKIMEREIEIELNEKGEAFKKVLSVRTDVLAMSQRYNYRFLSPEKRKEEMQNVLSRDEQLTSLDTLWFSDLNDLSDTVSYGYEYHTKDGVSFNGKLAIANLSLPDLISAGHYPSEADRELPVEMRRNWWANTNASMSIILKTPKNWKLLDLPESVKLNSKYGSYELSFKKTKEGLEIVRKGDFKIKDLILAAEYKEFKTFMDAVSAADAFQFIFKVP